MAPPFFIYHPDYHHIITAGTYILNYPSLYRGFMTSEEVKPW